MLGLQFYQGLDLEGVSRLEGRTLLCRMKGGFNQAGGASNPYLYNRFSNLPKRLCDDISQIYARFWLGSSE